MPAPSDPALYSRVKTLAKKKFKRWPSAYGSAWLTKEYTRRGGRYSGQKTARGVGRWMKEKWIQVSPYLTSGRKIACGAKRSRDAKACRPSKRISASTPKTVSELVARHGRSKLLRMARTKEAHMDRRMNWR